jgi:uncharacterized protein YqjF (DUF2071 family)
LAHRIALANSGVDIDGKNVVHTCPRRLCINADHLAAVSVAERVQRAPAYWREMTACRNGHALTPETISSYTRPDGRPTRRCKTCQQERDREYRERKKAARV